MKDKIDWFNILVISTFLVMMVIGGIFIFIPLIDVQNHLQEDLDELKDRSEYHSIDRVDIVPIETLQSDMSTTGHLVLGSGLISGKMMYSYYIKNSDGGYVLQQVDADLSTIYKDQNDNPYIIKHYSETNRLKKQFISSYTFHVPNETISRDYDVIK